MQETLHVDLLDFFRGERPWKQLYRFLEFLPSWGHYKSQLVMDDEWARYIVDQEEKAAEHPPADVDLTADDRVSPLGYTPVVGRLDLLLDRVQANTSAVLWSVNPKEQPPRVEPMPRPDTALDRERERRTRRLLEEVDAQFLSGELTLFG